MLILCTSHILVAQNDAIPPTKKVKKRTFYGTWGYNRYVYSKSNIHFENKGTPGDPDPTHQSYNFTIYNAKSHDSPDFNHIASSLNDVVNITIPQFSFRIGVYLNNKKDEGWEINYDHSKYVVTDGQTLRIKGTINGVAVDKDSTFERKYFHFEHTDGANFWLINYLKRYKFYTSKDGKSNIGLTLKPGLGIVYPRTDVTLFGRRLNNQWHIAGFMAGFEAGVRAELWDHLCLEFVTKAVYTDYLWCFVQYKGNGNANHRFGGVGSVLTIGYQFNL